PTPRPRCRRITRGCATSPRESLVLAKRTKHRKDSVLRAEAGLVVYVADLAVAGDDRGTVDSAEAEFRHLQLVIERAALQASQGQRGQDPGPRPAAAGLEDADIDQAVVHAGPPRRRETGRQVQRIPQEEQRC